MITAVGNNLTHPAYLMPGGVSRGQTGIHPSIVGQMPQQQRVGHIVFGGPTHLAPKHQPLGGAKLMATGVSASHLVATVGIIGQPHYGAGPTGFYYYDVPVQISGK